MPSGLRELLDLLFMEEKISSDSGDTFRVGFLKPKTAGNTKLTLWHLVNRLVPENANKSYKVQVKHVANGII